jgi:hypothetical protein
VSEIADKVRLFIGGSFYNQHSKRVNRGVLD